MSTRSARDVKRSEAAATLQIRGCRPWPRSGGGMIPPAPPRLVNALKFLHGMEGDDVGKHCSRWGGSPCEGSPRAAPRKESISASLEQINFVAGGSVYSPPSI